MTWTASITRRARQSTCAWLIAVGIVLPGMVLTGAAVAQTILGSAPKQASVSSPVSSALPLGTASGIGTQGFLPVDEAYIFTPLQNNDELLLRWQMPPGYYLYRDRVKVIAGEQILEVSLPEGLHKVDEYFGEVQVFYDGLDTSAPLPAGLDNVIVEYQGCADAGLCYPPVRRSIPLQPQ